MCIWVLCLLWFCAWSLFVTKRWRAPTSWSNAVNYSSPNSCHLRCKREHNPCGAVEGQEHRTIIGQMVSLASRMENVKTPIAIEIEHFVSTAAWVVPPRTFLRHHSIQEVCPGIHHLPLWRHCGSWTWRPAGHCHCHFLMTECLVELLPHLSESIRAQTSPLQRLISVVGCQRQEAAVEKHRVNNSPALKKADLGIAMGVAALEPKIQAMPSYWTTSLHL